MKRFLVLFWFVIQMMTPQPSKASARSGCKSVQQSCKTHGDLCLMGCSI